MMRELTTNDEIAMASDWTVKSIRQEADDHGGSYHDEEAA